MSISFQQIIRNNDNLNLICVTYQAISKNRYLDQGQEPIAFDTVAYHACRLQLIVQFS